MVFFEPKRLYRAAEDEVSELNLVSMISQHMLQVPVGDFEIPLGKAEVVMEGSDITLVGYGAQVNELQQAKGLIIACRYM